MREPIHQTYAGSIDTLLLSAAVNLATTEEQLRWALTQPVPFVAVGR